MDRLSLFMDNLFLYLSILNYKFVTPDDGQC
jgi:hypothetical protein